MHAVLKHRGGSESTNSTLGAHSHRLETTERRLGNKHFTLDGLVQFLKEEALVTSPLEHHPETGLLEGEVEEELDCILELALAVNAKGTRESLVDRQCRISNVRHCRCGDQGYRGY